MGTFLLRARQVCPPHDPLEHLVAMTARRPRHAGGVERELPLSAIEGHVVDVRGKCKQEFEKYSKNEAKKEEKFYLLKKFYQPLLKIFFTRPG